jgi:small basic protein
VENLPGALVEEGELPLSTTSMQDRAVAAKPAVNFLTVWTLPSVPGYILSFLFVKSVNAVVVTWLIFYLSMIGMKRESRIIAVLWAVSTFFGGLLGSYFNPTFNKTIFIASLLASAILFVFLEEVHLHPSETSVIILILTCGLIFGGPFTLMSSSIPLLLSEKPEIRNIPGAKAAIVSAMEGYGLLFCGISLLIVPTVGVIDLHWVASLYCTISAAILLYEHLRELSKELKEERKHITEPNIEVARQDFDLNMSAPVATGNRP